MTMTKASSVSLAELITGYTFVKLVYYSGRQKNLVIINNHPGEPNVLLGNSYRLYNG